MEWPLPHFNLDPIGKEWLLEFVGPTNFNEICGTARTGQAILNDCVIVGDQVAYLALQTQVARTDRLHGEHQEAS